VRATLRHAAAITALAGIVATCGPGARERGMSGLPALGGVAVAQAPAGGIGYAVVPERSEVRYRVREQLAGLSFPNDAVGATSAIAGRITLDAAGRPHAGGSRFTIDVRALRSDEARRDNYVRRNTLETDRYPMVVFVPTGIRGLAVPVPSTGSAPLEIAGNLTIREATRPVAWEGTATFNGDEIGVRARTAFRFAEFDLRVPRVSVVLSVDDRIGLEADLLLRRSP
jgi:polyisoprenoid-binding protein YceI